MESMCEALCQYLINKTYQKPLKQIANLYANVSSVLEENSGTMWKIEAYLVFKHEFDR
jgi:hypothetical protein